MKRTKSILATADFHCGHHAGLTPPQFQWKAGRDDTPFRKKVSQLQKTLWKDFSEKVKEFRPVETLLINGDAIGGKGERAGGREILFPDRDTQVDMASAIIDFVNPTNLVIVAGTPYHTGVQEQWEKQVFNRYSQKAIVDFGDHSYLDVNGTIISCKHFISSSAVPHGRATSLLRDGKWGQLWSLAYDDHPRARVFIRAHTHYYMQVDDDTMLGFILPALQAADTEFGKLRCQGTVSFGLVNLEIKPSGNVSWQKRTTQMLHAPVKPVKL